jgi:hypothetical protein
LSELKNFQWKGKSAGASIAYFVMDEEWNYKVKPYFEIFDKIHWQSHGQPTMKQLDKLHEHGINGGPSFMKGQTINFKRTEVLRAFYKYRKAGEHMCKKVRIKI